MIKQVTNDNDNDNVRQKQCAVENQIWTDQSLLVLRGLRYTQNLPLPATVLHYRAKYNDKGAAQSGASKTGRNDNHAADLTVFQCLFIRRGVGGGGRIHDLHTLAVRRFLRGGGWGGGAHGNAYAIW